MSEIIYEPRYSGRRRVDFPELDFEPDYRRMAVPRSSGGIVGRLSIGFALIAFGAVAMYFAILLFGHAIPGVQLKGWSFAAADAPAAPVAVPPGNQIAMQAREWGVSTCLGRVVDLSGFLTRNTNSRWLATRNRADPNGGVFAATLASEEPSTGLRGISNLYAAPTGSGGCDAAYQSTVFVPQSCAETHQTVFPTFTNRILLESNVTDAYATAEGDARVFLMPVGDAACIAVKTETFY